MAAPRVRCPLAAWTRSRPPNRRRRQAARRPRLAVVVAKWPENYIRLGGISEREASSGQTTAILIFSNDQEAPLYLRRRSRLDRGTLDRRFNDLGQWRGRGFGGRVFVCWWCCRWRRSRRRLYGRYLGRRCHDRWRILVGGISVGGTSVGKPRSGYSSRGNRVGLRGGDFRRRNLSRRDLGRAFEWAPHRSLIQLPGR